MSSASRKNSSGEPVIRAKGSVTTRSIAMVRPSGDHAAPMTSAMSGMATRSVQLNAAGPAGGVGVGARRGGLVGDATGIGLAVATEGGEEHEGLPAGRDALGDAKHLGKG